MYELSQFRALIMEEKKTATFDDLERKYGGNRWHFAELINNPDFRPSAKICKKWGVLHEKPAPVCTNRDCEGYGEPHVFDCRTQQVRRKSKPREYKDLLAMPKRVLLWKLENRN